MKHSFEMGSNNIHFFYKQTGYTVNLIKCDNDNNVTRAFSVSCDEFLNKSKIRGDHMTKLLPIVIT